MHATSCNTYRCLAKQFNKSKTITNSCYDIFTAHQKKMCHDFKLPNCQRPHFLHFDCCWYYLLDYTGHLCMQLCEVFQMLSCLSILHVFLILSKYMYEELIFTWLCELTIFLVLKNSNMSKIAFKSH